MYLDCLGSIGLPMPQILQHRAQLVGIIVSGLKQSEVRRDPEPVVLGIARPCHAGPDGLGWAAGCLGATDRSPVRLGHSMGTAGALGQPLEP